MNNRRMVSWLVVVAALAMPAGLSLGQDPYLSQLYGRGVHAYFKCDYLGAQKHLDDAISSGVNDPRAYYFRGLIKSQMGNRYDAEGDYRMAATLEARGAGTFDIGRALIRVQGQRRLELEAIRQEVLIFARNQRPATTETYPFEPLLPSEPLLPTGPETELEPAADGLPAEESIDSGESMTDDGPGDPADADPFGPDELDEDPFAEDPFAEDRANADEMGDDPFAEDEAGADEMGDDPFAQDEAGADEMGADEMGDDPSADEDEDPFAPGVEGEAEVESDTDVDPFAADEGLEEDTEGGMEDDPFSDSEDLLEQ